MASFRAVALVCNPDYHQIPNIWDPSCHSAGWHCNIAPDSDSRSCRRCRCRSHLYRWVLYPNRYSMIYRLAHCYPRDNQSHWAEVDLMVEVEVMVEAGLTDIPLVGCCCLCFHLLDCRTGHLRSHWRYRPHLTDRLHCSLRCYPLR